MERIKNKLMEENIERYKGYFEDYSKNVDFNKSPKELYAPIEYILKLGGKRIRPMMMLLVYEILGRDPKEIVEASLAIEYFHNFTLMHDDIMDHAEVRRGKPSVHVKYSTNTAILSGDAMLIQSYQLLEKVPDNEFKTIIQWFSKTALEICEGQQLDMNFEDQHEVSYEEYIKMITLKTGVLGAISMKIGALLADASVVTQESLYQFGLHLGIAFQLLDDYIDVFGDQEKVGKKHAGDIYENKKTILYILAMQQANEDQKNELHFWYSTKSENIDKVYGVERIFLQLGVDHMVKDEIQKYHDLASIYIEKSQLTEEQKKPLHALSNYLISREF